MGSEEPLRVGIVGLGAMGAAIAERLHSQGARLVLIEPDAERRAAVARGVHPASDSIAEADLSDCDLVMVAVRTEAQVDAVLDALAAGPAPRAVGIISTLSIGAARALASRSATLRVLELPVSGGPSGARDGTLTVLHGGPALDAPEAAVLQAVSARVVSCGAFGQAAALKLANNLIGAYNALALATVLERAEAEGVPARDLLEVARTSSGGSWMADRFEDFAADLLIKDVHLLRRDWSDLVAVTPDGDPEQFLARIEAVRALLG